MNPFTVTSEVERYGQVFGLDEKHFATLNQFINGKLLILEKNDRINSLFETRAVDAETVNSIVILISDILVVLIFLWIIKKIVNFLYNKLRRKETSKEISRGRLRKTEVIGRKFIVEEAEVFQIYLVGLNLLEERK